MGTTAAVTHESESDGRERDAFNAAFRELGLRWHWDRATFAGMTACATDAERVRTYLETRASHLLTAYEASFLTDAVCATKARLRTAADRAPWRRATRAADCAEYATAQHGF